MPKVKRTGLEPDERAAIDRLLNKPTSCAMCWTKHKGDGRYCGTECEERAARPGGPEPLPYSGKRPMHMAGKERKGGRKCLTT